MTSIKDISVLCIIGDKMADPPQNDERSIGTWRVLDAYSTLSYFFLESNSNVQVLYFRYKMYR